jgi:hypothetical protein
VATSPLPHSANETFTGASGNVHSGSHEVSHGEISPIEVIIITASRK